VIGTKQGRAEMATKTKSETETDATSDTISKEDFEKMKAALAKANEEAKNYRLAAKAKDEELTAAQAAQDTSKSEMDKIQEQITALTQRAEKAEHAAMVKDIAMSKKIPAALAGRLAGATQEELEADADQLIEALGLHKDNGNSDLDEAKPEPGPFGRPTETLRPGASNVEDEAPDYEKIAEKIASRHMT